MASLLTSQTIPVAVRTDNQSESVTSSVPTRLDCTNSENTASSQNPPHQGDMSNGAPSNPQVPVNHLYWVLDVSIANDNNSLQTASRNHYDHDQHTQKFNSVKNQDIFGRALDGLCDDEISEGESECTETYCREERMTTSPESEKKLRWT